MKALAALKLGARHPRGEAFFRVWVSVLISNRSHVDCLAPTALIKAMAVPKFVSLDRRSKELEWAVLCSYGGDLEPIWATLCTLSGQS